jgi:hypothetical protein
MPEEAEGAPHELNHPAATILAIKFDIVVLALSRFAHFDIGRRRIGVYLVVGFMKGILSVKPPPDMQRIVEARIMGINAKKMAGLDRVRHLLSALPPDVRAKLEQRELKSGFFISNQKKTPDKAVIQSPSPGMYSWNGSNAMIEAVILGKIITLTKA